VVHRQHLQHAFSSTHQSWHNAILDSSCYAIDIFTVAFALRIQHITTGCAHDHDLQEGGAGGLMREGGGLMREERGGGGGVNGGIY
jgi:hypothetical protein